MAKLQLETINPMVLQQLDPELVSYTFHTVHNWCMLRVEQRCVVHAPARYPRPNARRPFCLVTALPPDPWAGNHRPREPFLPGLSEKCRQRGTASGLPGACGYDAYLSNTIQLDTGLLAHPFLSSTHHALTSISVFLAVGLHQQGSGARLQQPGCHLRPAQQVAAEVRTAPSQLTSEVHV